MTDRAHSPLAEHLRRRIALEGPLTIAAYMETALLHPRFGYYATRDPLGRSGDFITAPEISQMFGELIGAWLAHVWQGLGAPIPVRLIEFGPGRGTLMADVLRIARLQPAFRAALRVHLIEASPALRQKQQQTLSPYAGDVLIEWHDHFGQVPGGALLAIANEFFDALPVRQYQKYADGWRERLVGIDERDAFAFVLSPLRVVPPTAAAAGARIGDIVEISSAAIGLADALARRVVADGGATLAIDYGAEPPVGGTFQAVRAHQRADPLSMPGELDLTAHVDFAALARVAREAGAEVFGPVTQGRFLDHLGIAARAERLMRQASPDQAAVIEAARARLVEPGGMGSLFKAIAWQAPGCPPPPGF